MPISEYIMAPIDRIGLHYENLRIICPRAEAAMARSMERYGQMTPVLLGRGENLPYEMVDGFKRLRAGRKLCFTEISARMMPGHSRAWKAAMIQMNTRVRTIDDLEKALVMRSLYREDGLSQKEIAILLDRHKSWVSRRLALVENLCEEILEHISLGLINITIGRELARLPRGNQVEALSTVTRYRMNSRETAQFVGLLLRGPDCVLRGNMRLPAMSLLYDRQPPKPRLSKQEAYIHKLFKAALFLSSPLPALTKEQHKRVALILERIRQALQNYEADHGALHQKP
jgi:hypothetical protein